MAKLTSKTLNAGLNAGQTVSEIAAAAGCSIGRVYQLMRKGGKPAHQLRSEQSTRPKVSAECRTFVGYRVSTLDGRVQSCWSSGCSPQRTTLWRDLTISQYRGRLFVQLGGAGSRRRISLRAVYRDAFGAMQEATADALYDKVRRKLLGE